MGSGFLYRMFLCSVINIFSMNLNKKGLHVSDINNFRAMKARYIIGIDPGVKTGLSVWDSNSKKFENIQTVPIHDAMDFIRNLEKGLLISTMYVRIEDARQRKWFGNAGREQLQGAGSIKRDCKIWEDFLIDLGIEFEMVAPKNNKTKLDAKKFAQVTKWEARTSEHARDAAMLCFGY